MRSTGAAVRDRSAERLVGREGIRECKNDRFSPLSVSFRGWSVLRVAAQIRPGGIDSPRYGRNLEPLQNREALVDVFLSTFPKRGAAGSSPRARRISRMISLRTPSPT
jgi:hypothetical protein